MPDIAHTPLMRYSRPVVKTEAELCLASRALLEAQGYECYPEIKGMDFVCELPRPKGRSFQATRG